MTVRLLREAEAELEETVTHYESQLTGLGIAFAAEVRQGLVESTNS